MFRKLLFWSHLVIGVVAGLVILTMAGSGLLIAYQKQIVTAAERSIANLPGPEAGAAPLSLGELAKQVSAAVPDERPTGFTVRRDPRDPALVNFGRERVMLANPQTGALIGEASKWRGFLHAVEDFHRALALGPNGKLITGAASIAFLALLVSGLFLWWPRKWNRANVAAVTIPSLKLRGKARHWNWHNAFGFWAALPLLVAIVTGMIISYRWANNLLFRLTGNEPPAPRAAPARAENGRGGGREAASAPLRFDVLAKMWATGIERAPAWQTVMLRLGENSGAPVAMILDEGTGARPDQRAQLTFDGRTGEPTKWEPYASQNLGRQLRMWVKPVHTGEAFGLIGQTISALAALAACILVWTGFGLALRRFRQRRAVANIGATPSSATKAPAEAAASTTTLSS